MYLHRQMTRQTRRSSNNGSKCKLICFAITIFMLFGLVPKGYAQSQSYILTYEASRDLYIAPYYAYVSASSLKIRSGPGTGNPQIGLLFHDQRIRVLARSGSWLKIRHGSGPAYVSANYVSRRSSGSRLSPHFGGPTTVTEQPIDYGPVVNTSNDLNVPDYHVYVTASALNVRKGPGTKYAIHKSIPNNHTVKVTHQQGLWLRIEWPSGLAYIHGNYVKRKDIFEGAEDPEGLMPLQSKPAETANNASSDNTSSNSTPRPVDSFLLPSALCNWQSPKSYIRNYYVTAFKKTQMRGQPHTNCPAGNRHLAAGGTGRVVAESGDWVYLQNTATEYYGWVYKPPLFIKDNSDSNVSNNDEPTDTQQVSSATIGFIPSLATQITNENVIAFVSPYRGGTLVSSDTPNCSDIVDRHRHAVYCELLSIGVDFAPVGGDIKGLVEAYTGRDLLTDEELALWERGAGLILCTECRRVGEFGGFIIRRVDNIFRRSPNTSDEVADLVDDVNARPTGPTPATTIPEPPKVEFKWDNPKSKPTFGHTFIDHGQKKSLTSLKDRARGKGHQVGQFLDDNAAAGVISKAAQNYGPGVHTFPIPDGLTTRVVLPDGTEVIADRIRIVVRPNGALKTAFPYNSNHPNS